MSPTAPDLHWHELRFCQTCGEVIRYVSGPKVGLWVHESTRRRLESDQQNRAHAAYPQSQRLLP